MLLDEVDISMELPHRNAILWNNSYSWGPIMLVTLYQKKPPLFFHLTKHKNVPLCLRHIHRLAFHIGT